MDNSTLDEPFVMCQQSPRLNWLPRLLLLLGLGASFGTQAASAIVTVKTDQGQKYYQTADQPNREVAERVALDLCARNASDHRHLAPCKLGESADGPNYWAVVLTTSGEPGWSYASDQQSAIDAAYRVCLKRRSGRCLGKADAVWFDSVGRDGVVEPIRPEAEIPENVSLTPPSGQWTRIGSGTEVQLLVDRNTINRRGDVITAWVLYSMAEESVANLNQHRCQAGQYRTLLWKHYSEPMAKGESSDGHQPEAWRSGASDPLYKSVMQTLCRIRTESVRPKR